MYHTYYPQPLWPLSAAPLPPVSDTALRVVAELSGTWEGGTVPGLYADSTWQLSREIALPDSAWLYVPYLVGEVSVYVGERLWSCGERMAWIPLIGPGKVKLTLRGKGRGGLLGGVYLLARKGPMAWPLDAHSFSPPLLLSETLSPQRPEAAKSSNTISQYKLSFWAAASAQRALAAAVRARPSPLHIKKALASKWYNPIWLWPIGMLLWALSAWWSVPIRQAHSRGPWTAVPPHPLENILGLILTGFFLLVLTDWALLGVTLAISLPLETLFCTWHRCPPEKIWQSWLPVLLLAWIFAPAFSPIEVAWGGWGLRTLMLTLYMPRLAYLCLGSAFFYLLTCT